MRRISSIARATAVEILGEPLSLLLLLAAAVVAVLSPVFHFHQFGEVTRMSRDAAFSAQFMFGTAFAVFCTIKSVRREIESGTMDMALAHSVSRAEFFLAKCAGAFAAYLLFASVVFFIAVIMVDGAAVGGVVADKTGDVARIWGVAAAAAMAVPVLSLVVSAFVNYFARRRFTLMSSLLMAAMAPVAATAVSVLVRDVSCPVRMLPVACLLVVPAALNVACAAAFSMRFKANISASLSFAAVALSIPFVGNYFMSEALSKGGEVSWGYVALAFAAALPALAAFLLVGISFARRGE